MPNFKVKNLPIILGLAVLALAIPVAVFLSTQKGSLTLLTRAGKEKVAVFYLWPAEIHLSPEEEVAVKIILTTQEKTAGKAQAKIMYDPQVLLLKSIEKGVIFNKYTDKVIDQEKGTAEIKAQGEFSGTATFATLNFTPQKKGESLIDFVLAGSKVEDKAGADILQGVNGGILVVE